MKQAVSCPEFSPSWPLCGIILNEFNYNVSESSSSSTTWCTIHDNEIDNATPPSLYLLKGCTRAIEIVASSNGLILYNDESQLYISNPLTKESVELPFPPTLNLYMLFILPLKFCFATCVGQLGGESSKPTPNPNPAYVSYKFVFIQRYTKQDVRKVYISTFGSDNGRWSNVTSAIVPRTVVLDSEPSASKGVLHWFDCDAKALITYYPYGSHPGRFREFPLPNLGSNRKILKSRVNRLILLGHEDSLKVGEIEDCGDFLGLRLSIWLLLDSVKGEWSLWQTCVISPDWDLSELTKCTIVAPFPWNEEIFCGLWREGDNPVPWNKEIFCRLWRRRPEGDRIKARDLESGQDICIHGSISGNFEAFFLICPYCVVSMVLSFL